MSKNPKSIYEQIIHAEKESTIQDILDKEKSKQIRCHMPCKVVSVNGTRVDVEIQGKEDTGLGFYSSFPLLVDLPIVYNCYTSSSYIITPVQVGDTGVVEFLDFNTTNFNDVGSKELTSDNYYHSLNNGCFINGFIPTSKTIPIDDTNNPIMIGLQNKTFTLTVTRDGSLTIDTSCTLNINSSMGVNVNSPKVDFSGDINVANGASGAFSSSNGDTISVVNGIIVKIGEDISE